jgi:hypothetical protein
MLTETTKECPTVEFIVEVDGVDFTAADVEWALRAAFPATFAEEGTTVRVTSGETGA